jgi:hypothetical protein
MAYRGDTTDPLQIVINQRRATRRIILLMVVLVALPMFARRDRGSLSTVLGLEGRRQSPSRTVQSPGTASATRSAGMSAGDVEQWLRTAPASNPAPSEVRCRRDNAWDYVCTYRAGAGVRPRYQIGVRVDADKVVLATPPYPITTRLPGP